MAGRRFPRLLFSAFGLHRDKERTEGKVRRGHGFTKAVGGRAR